MTMSSFALSVAVFFCLSVTWTWALPKRPFSNGESSGAGEIPDEFPRDFRPFDGPLGKGSSGKEVFNDYDLDEEPQRFPEDYENEIPEEGGSKHPSKPDDRIPEDKHPEDEPKEEEKEEDDHEPPSKEEPKEGEETHDDEEEEEAGTKGGEEEPHGSEEEDTHGEEDEEKHQEDGEESQEDGEESQEGEEKIPLPLKPALFSFQQVNHYIKQLEKAMEHVFKDTLEDSSLLNNTYANSTENEVEVDGHKYKVHKSIIETGDPDKNSTLVIEEISSVREDEPKESKTKVKRSNPDAEPIQ